MDTTNMDDAISDLNLNEQETHLYQLHLENLHGPDGVDNPDGSRATVYGSVEEHEGKFYTIPTVWEGKVETEPFIKHDQSVVDVANKTALNHVDTVGWDRFPSYDTPEEADKRYTAIHEYMAKDTKQLLEQRSK